jgi:ketosteroid isomerase-like protein
MALPSIEDRFGINDLFVRYTCALDAGDADTVVDCFTEDGTLVSPAVGEHTGRAAITAFAQRFSRFQAGGSQLRHVLSNLTVFLTKDGKSKLLAPGRYDCELRKADGQWRFRRRVVLHDHDYTLEGL